jgi:hypothetical protein
VIAAGAVLGVLILHPVTMVIYWFEFRSALAQEVPSLWSFVFGRLLRSFTPSMLPMSALFAGLGSAAGLVLSAFLSALSAQQRATRSLREELRRDLPSIIAGGESEKIEFKSSLRWDRSSSCVNRSLETVVAKTIAGFLNGAGGSLILGVDDTGAVVGLAEDFGTLKRPDRDGFEQFVMGLVKQRLGGDLCPLVHPVFSHIAASEVCRLVVEPSHRPVYLEEGRDARLYLRMGNSTRWLDVREAVDYVAQRWPRSSGTRAPEGG